MRIGIFGTGSVGTALARGFADHGIEVMLGTRNPDSPKIAEWLASSPHAHAGTYAEAADFGDIVVTAVPGRVVAETIEALDPALFIGKIIVDPSNPVRFSDGVPEAVYPPDDSAAEHIQRLLPAASVVKAFNQVNPEQMLAPDPVAGPRTIRICGDGTQAKSTVTALLEEFGWRVEDVGPLSEARRLERGVVNYFMRQAAG